MMFDRRRSYQRLAAVALTTITVAAAGLVHAAVTFPPALPEGKTVVTDSSDVFLKPSAALRDGVVIAHTPPTVDFLYYPGQDYPGKIWSTWGDSTYAGDKYWSGIGDHDAPKGNAFLYEYDSANKSLRRVVDLRKTLNLPEGYYTPGKIHSRVDMGSDGKVYFATHRGSPKATTDANHYTGDWIFSYDPKTGESAVVVSAPVPKHSVPCSVLDPERMVFYGSTAAGVNSDKQDVQFFAYDIRNRKMLYSGGGGPSRYMILAQSTGRVYFNPDKHDEMLMRYDPKTQGDPERIDGDIGIRAATKETADGYVYAVSQGHGGEEAMLYDFNTKTEKITELGPAAVASQTYIASIDVDPTGRYLYYIPGAHGSGDRDGTPVVQYEIKTRRRKVIAFLHPFYQDKYGVTLKGTYTSALDDKGETLFVTWNANRGSRAWDTCALTAIHIPASER